MYPTYQAKLLSHRIHHYNR